MLDPFVEIAGDRLRGQESLARMALALTIDGEHYPGGTRYSLQLENHGNQTLTLDRVGLCLPFISSGEKRQWRVYLDQGACGWCGVKPLECLDPNPHMQPVREQRLTDDGMQELPFHRSDLQTVVWDAMSGETVLAGFLRQRYGLNRVDVIPNAGADDIDRLEASQDFGIEFAPGAVQPLDIFILARGNDPYGMMEEFATAVAEHHGHKLDAPPVVGMMTWYGYRTAIDQDIVAANSRIVGDLFGGYPQPMQKVMLLDHGWEEDANWGYWKPDSRRFSRGMEWVRDELAKDDLKMGLWYTPFCITQNAPDYQQLLPLQAFDLQGKPLGGEACVWGDLPGHKRGLWPITFFDAGKDIVQAKWQDELAAMKKWGTHYWKLDFFALLTGHAQRKKLGIGDLWAQTWENWRKVVGYDAHLAPCSCYTNLQIGYCDSVRIGSDIGNAGHWPGANEFRYGMATIIDLWYKNRKFWVNDPDSIQIAKGCSLAEARVRATVVALSGGHLMLSEDLRGVGGERIEMIRRLIPPYPQAARPLDMFENPFPEGYPRFWSLSLDTGFGPMKMLAVFNLTGKTQTYEITPEMLGIERGAEFLALEWWQYKWLGRFNGKFTIDVPAEDVFIIHAQPVKDVPSMISCSHHITGGYIVEDVSFDEESGILRGVLVTKAGIPAVLFGHAPAEWQLSREAGYHTTISSIGGWQSEITTTSTHTKFEIEFEKTEKAL